MWPRLLPGFFCCISATVFRRELESLLVTTITIPYNSFDGGSNNAIVCFRVVLVLNVVYRSTWFLHFLV